MLYVDYSWDLSPGRLVFDEELNIDKLGWQQGDMFEVQNIDGRAMLVKLDPLVAWVKAGGQELKNG
jgi:hypothetical protein